MIKWHNLPGEHSELFSPVGLRPLDEITKAALLGKVRISLDFKDENGNWQKTGIKPVITPSGVITYPGLERRVEVVGQPVRRYRIRLDAELYRPLYPAGTDGYEFDAFPYNDAEPPQKNASEVSDIFMTPATNYPFSTHVYVLHGDVRDPAGVKVSDALVTESVKVTENAKERVLTDERGAFALPLRRVWKSVTLSINARDRENKRKGTITIKIPEDIGKNHTISIS